MKQDLSWDLFCADYAEVLAQNRARLSFFLSLKADFERNNISVLPLKGLDLLIRAYPSLGARPMADMDFLILKQDVAKVRELLESRGFFRQPDEGLTYLSSDRTLNFDILWNIWYLSEEDQALLWKRKVKRKFEGYSYDCLHPEDALLYLVAYVTAHRGVFSPLLVRDLTAFLEQEKENICWERLRRHIWRLHLNVPCFHGFSYALQNGLEGIPEGWLQSLKPQKPLERFELFLYRHWVNENAQPKVSYLFTWLGYPGLKGKIKLLREKLLPSRFEFEIHTGKKSWMEYFLHFFLHLFLIFGRGIVLGVRDLAKLFKKPKTRLDAKNL